MLRIMPIASTLFSAFYSCESPGNHSHPRGGGELARQPRGEALRLACRVPLGGKPPLGAAGGLWADLAVPRQTRGRHATSCTTQAVLRSLFRAGEALFFQSPETGIYVFPARQAQTLPPFSFSLKK